MRKNDMKTNTHIPLIGLCNARHLGGYRTENGQKTRDYAFIRCESPVRASAFDIRALLGLGIDTVIDMRNADETERERNPFASASCVQYMHIPLAREDMLPSALDGAADMGAFYVRMLEERKEAVQAVFLQMLYAKHGVLFHCTAGKDRTGLISALLLLLAGVATPVVVEEYAITNLLLAPWINIQRKELGNAIEPDCFTAKPAYIRTAITHIAEHYGDVQAYLLSAGLKPWQCTALKDRMIAPKEAALPIAEKLVRPA
jgi:protein-tyrosine phosphatase